jgi:3-hydroxyacyl-CoA dehydrogenase
VPERLDLKREVFGELDRLADPDAVLGSNASSLPSSSFIDDVDHVERGRRTWIEGGGCSGRRVRPRSS